MVKSHSRWVCFGYTDIVGCLGSLIGIVYPIGYQFTWIRKGWSPFGYVQFCCPYQGICSCFLNTPYLICVIAIGGIDIIVNSRTNQYSGANCHINPYDKCLAGCQVAYHPCVISKGWHRIGIKEIRIREVINLCYVDIVGSSIASAIDNNLICYYIAGVGKCRCCL